MMPTKEDIKKVAANARIMLCEEELEILSKDAEQILGHFSMIEEADTSSVEPSFQPVRLSNIFREDAVRPPISQDDALSQTQHKKDGFFKGPRVT